MNNTDRKKILDALAVYFKEEKELSDRSLNISRMMKQLHDDKLKNVEKAEKILKEI